MNVLLQTRCGCLKGATIETQVAPANISIELQMNDDLNLSDEGGEESIVRKFTYIGTNRGDNKPVYLESIDQDGYRVPKPLATIGQSIEQSKETD